MATTSGHADGFFSSGVYHAIATHDMSNASANDSLRSREANLQGVIRVSDALRSAHGRAAADRQGGLQNPYLYPVRARLVPLFHAPYGERSRQLAFFLPTGSARKKRLTRMAHTVMPAS